MTGMIRNVFCLTAVASLAAGAVSAADCDGVEPVGGEALSLRLVRSTPGRLVDAAAPPGDVERLFLVTQQGLIRIIRPAEDGLAPVVFLDISDRVEYRGDLGLLGIAFHPEYAATGWFFLNYNASSGSGDTVIARYRVSAADPDAADRDSELVVLTFDQPAANHNGGQVAFSPRDGYLYVGFGDGGNQHDPSNYSQNPLVYHGKMLRLDVDSVEPYAVPPDNPFVGQDGVLPEIWSLGLRNPWRFAFDPLQGDFYISDVGQGAREEINYQPATSTGGENYEWKVYEGTRVHDAATAFTIGTRAAPLLEYPHSGATVSGRSVTGGVVYRGCAIPGLHGTYFFADYAENWVRSFRVEDGGVTDLRDHTAAFNDAVAPESLDRITAFGADGQGEIYICEIGGDVFKIVPAEDSPPLGPRFQRGDANVDLSLDVSDAIFTLLYLFRATPPEVLCLDALDSNDDEEVNISDVVFSLEFLFRRGITPPDPFAGCGVDPTDDARLGCEQSACE